MWVVATVGATTTDTSKLRKFSLTLEMCMGMGKTGIPVHMGFLREWEYDQPWVENRVEMGIRCMGTGIKTLDREKSLHTVSSKHVQQLVLVLKNLKCMYAHVN